MRVSVARMGRRMAGRLGCGGDPAPALPAMLFPPSRRCCRNAKASWHNNLWWCRPCRRERRSRPVLEVVEPQLFLHLLVHLLADLASLDKAASILRSVSVGRLAR